MSVTVCFKEGHMRKTLLSVAACLLSIPGVTFGAIVYSGSQNVTLSLHPMSPMDSKTIQLGGMAGDWDDFRVELWLDMSMSDNMMTGMATKLAIYAPSGMGTDMGMGGVLGQGNFASNLSMGSMIGRDSSFLSWAYLYGSGEFGEDGGYVGLRTAMGNFGYLHVAKQSHIGTNKHSVTFDGWAYEDQPGVPIGAGVVRDAAGGSVSGGGWINSPIGAYVPDPALAGKANFGFASKYEKGTNVPRGNTEFQFKAGHMNFHSSSYDWLVVDQNGSSAQFKGSGTVNGSGTYKFMLWAGDAVPDTFRIRIWSEGSDGAEVVVYDNGSNQAIGGGSIVVHTK